MVDFRFKIVVNDIQFNEKWLLSSSFTFQQPPINLLVTVSYFHVNVAYVDVLFYIIYRSHVGLGTTSELINPDCAQ